MPTALEIQQQQWAAQQAAQQAGQVHTTGGIQPRYNPYNDPFNTELRRGATNLSPADAGVPAATTTTAAVTDPNAALLAAQRSSALADFKVSLEAWGLGDLVGWATALYTSENAPTSFNEFYLQLKQQPVYKQRFGDTNDARIKAGLPALSEASIMGLESQYKKTLASYGLPSSFYDQPADFQKFIVNDLSASEVADRVEAANAFVKMQNPQIRQQLATYYGISDGALTAAQLDPSKGQQILEQLAAKQTAAIAAGTAGLGVNEAQQAQSMGAGDMTFAKQAQAFGEAAQTGAQGQTLSSIYAPQGAAKYGIPEAITESFSGANAFQEQEKRKRLGKMEEAAFSGSSGVSSGSLGVAQTSGNL